MKLVKLFTCAAALICGATTTQAGPISAGDLVVYRAGTGSAALSSAATAVFVDEYTTTGVFVQSIPMPTAASGTQLPLTASGTATSEGYLNLSKDGRYVVLTGYAAAPGLAGVAATTSAANPRVVGRIDANGAVDTSTNFTSAYSGNNVRSAYTTNGTTIWASGTGTGSTGGVWTTSFGATGGSQVSSSTGVANTRVLEDFLNQLYVSSSSGTNVGVNTVGSGEPTASGQPVSLVVGSASAYDFFFADLDSSVPGLDTAYVADDNANVGGIRKFSLVGGTWTLNNVIGTGADSYRGLTGQVTANGIQLFATRQGGTSQGIVTLTDSSGYNANNNGTANLIVPLPSNTAFRGIDFAPIAVPEPSTWVLAVMALVAAAVVQRRTRLGL
jgi:hypothetical protein